MPTRPAPEADHVNAAFVSQLLQETLNLIAADGRQYLPEVVQGATVRVVIPDVFEEQFLVGFMIEAALASIGTLFAKGCI